MQTSNNDIFAEKGKATQFAQYDDVTFRRIEVISLNAAARSDYVFGVSNDTLFANLKRFNFHFGGLYDCTFLETENHLSKEDIKRIKSFLMNPIGGTLSGYVSDNKNRQMLCNATVNLLEVFEIYERALKKAGFRNISYMSLKKEYKSLENK